VVDILVVLLAAPVHTNHAIGTGIEDVERVSHEHELYDGSKQLPSALDCH